uniref:Uncharacterized protein n=1 Tax=Strongyloides venezuelensis TaxID=75913 RepID=A0A0K0FP81_STRVS
MTTIRDSDKRIFANNYKIPKLKKRAINFFDNSLKTFILPREYKRTIKPFKEFNNYKALEWKLFMFYGFPTIFLEALKDEVNGFVILQLAIISTVEMLMMDNISEDQISLSSNLLSLWFDKKVKHLGFNDMKLKCHIITHLPVIARKFGNITKYSCFAGEGLIQTLGRMILQRTEKNSLNQIKKRFKDLHVACYVIRKEVFKNLFMNISNVFRDIFNDKIPLLHQYKFIDKIDLKGFFIRASMNSFLNKDNFLITQVEKDGKIIYKPGILLALAINEKKKCFILSKN